MEMLKWVLREKKTGLFLALGAYMKKIVLKFVRDANDQVHSPAP
jgi:hypothetical protein